MRALILVGISASFEEGTGVVGLGVTSTELDNDTSTALHRGSWEQAKESDKPLTLRILHAPQRRNKHSDKSGLALDAALSTDCSYVASVRSVEQATHNAAPAQIMFSKAFCAVAGRQEFVAIEVFLDKPRSFRFE